MGIIAGATNETGRCLGCAFWFEHGSLFDRRVGRCHARAPTATDDDGFAVWPKTYGTSWCGDYEQSAAGDNDSED